jgi:hypothetical protein
MMQTARASQPVLDALVMQSDAEIRAALAGHAERELAKRSISGAMVYFVVIVLVAWSTPYASGHPVILALFAVAPRHPKGSQRAAGEKSRRWWQAFARERTRRRSRRQLRVGSREGGRVCASPTPVEGKGARVRMLSDTEPGCIVRCLPAYGSQISL